MREDQEPLLLDTSVWVHSLRRRGWADLRAAVQQALDADRVATCWVVRAELLIGARDPAGIERLSAQLSGLPDVLITATVWDQAARLGYALRRQGLVVRLPDLLIAQCAISTGRVLWHADADFERLRQLSALRTRHWVAAE